MSSSAITLNNNRPQFHTKILIVDNQNFGSQFIINGLRRENGITVVGTARSELETFVEIQCLEPDIVIIDVDTPEIDSYSLIKRIKDNFAEITILVLTESSQPKIINRALSLGAKGFLIKSFQTEEISSAIHAVTYDRSGDTKLQLPSPEDPETSSLLAKYSNKIDTASNKNNFAQDSAISDGSSGLAIIQTSDELPALIAEREDWSAATSDLLDALPRVWTRGLLYFLIIGTGIILPWSILTKVDQTGTARGKLEPKNKVVRLDAPVAGKIKAINVKEGDKVKKGAILAELGSEIVNSELEQLKDQRAGQDERLIKLEAARVQASMAIKTKEDESRSRQLEKQSQLAQAQQNYNTLKTLYESQKAEKQAQIEQVKQEINSSIAVRKEAELALAGVEDKSQRYEAAYAEGVISQDRFLDVQQQAKESKERLAQTNSALLQAKSKLSEQQSSYRNLIKQSKSEIEQAFLRLEEQQRSGEGITATGKLEKLETEKQVQTLETQISALKTESTQTDKQIESALFQLKQRQLFAPADGTVFHVPVKGKGTVVQPGERMIEIAPKDSTLILKAQIPPTDSGFLKPEMPVKIKFDAYPFQDYGVSNGKLISVSPDSKVMPTAQGEEETYELKVELERPYIVDEGNKITLSAGQTATAEVVVRQRRVIDFFIDPFKQLQQDGVRL